MVLRPIPETAAARGTVPAWNTVQETQFRRAAEYWLITQPDHAALAGAIAAGLGPPLVPELAPEIVRGVAVHDDGWAEFDAQVRCAEGKPVSFLEPPPSVFVPAWRASIERAAGVAPLAGAMVSRHFWRLGRSRADSASDSGEDRTRLMEFLSQEEQRQRRLASGGAELEALTDVLQFCDLLSLYLCCGSRQDVEFPQKFGGRTMRLRRESPDRGSAVCRFEPSPFARGGVDVAVAARRFPDENDPSTRMFPFLLW